MEVEVDLYSGRPNPTFHLGAVAAAELMRRLAALPPLSARAMPRETLGYRGLHIKADEVRSPITEIMISDGVVVIRSQNSAERYLQDSNRQLERWLIKSGTANLNPDEITILRQDLES